MTQEVRFLATNRNDSKYNVTHIKDKFNSLYIKTIN